MIESKAATTDVPMVPKEYETVYALERKYRKLLQLFLDQKRGEIMRLPLNYHRGHVTAKAFTTDNLFHDIAFILSPAAMKSKIKELIGRIIEQGVEQIEKQLDVNIPRDIQYNEMLGEESFKKIKGLTDDLESRLRQEMLEGWGQGEGISELKERVKMVWGNQNLTDARAEAIARTETNYALNDSRYQAAKRSGIPVVKRWNAYLDSRTGEDSKKLNGQTRHLDQDFYDEVNQIFVPHPPNRPRCRCRMDIVPI